MERIIINLCLMIINVKNDSLRANRMVYRVISKESLTTRADDHKIIVLIFIAHELKHSSSVLYCVTDQSLYQLIPYINTS